MRAKRMARMSPDEARREFDRLRERFERELTGRMDDTSGPAGCLPLNRGGFWETGGTTSSVSAGALPPSPKGEGYGEAQTSADVGEDEKGTSSVTASPCHLPHRGKAFGTSRDSEEIDDGFWETEIRRG